MIVNERAILALTPNADHTDKEGFFIELSSGAASIVNSAADLPYGLILDGETTNGKDTIALCAAFSGIVTVKVTDTAPGTIAAGVIGTVKSDGTVQADAGSGARVQVCQFLEAGVANELVKAVLLRPVALS